MATANDTIKRALRMINVLAAGETASSADANDALEILNDMLHGWAKMGVDLGHSTMSLTSTHQTHDSYLEGIRANLAVRLAGEWGRPIPPAVAKIAEDSFRAFQAHTIEFPDDAKVDRALQPRYFRANRRGAYDIDEG